MLGAWAALFETKAATQMPLKAAIDKLSDAKKADAEAAVSGNRGRTASMQVGTSTLPRYTLCYAVL